jgi:hypothetical protein
MFVTFLYRLNRFVFPGFLKILRTILITVFIYKILLVFFIGTLSNLFFKTGASQHGVQISGPERADGGQGPAAHGGEGDAQEAQGRNVTRRLLFKRSVLNNFCTVYEDICFYAGRTESPKTYYLSSPS